MNSNSDYQERYWCELDQLKVHIFYINAYLLNIEKHDRLIKIILAITSNTSICGWAIWDKHQFVWALIIALSHLVDVVKNFLPYKKLKQRLEGLNSELEELFLFAEQKWFDVAEGKLTNEQIHNLRIELKKRKEKIVNKYLKGYGLPEKTKLIETAREQAKDYFSIFYPSGGQK